MKRLILSNRYIFIFCIIVSSFSAHAQKESNQIIQNGEVKILIDSIAKLVQHYYILEQTGRDVGAFIKKKQKEGGYNNLSYKEFGNQLTTDLRENSNNVHMSAFYSEQKEKRQETILSKKLDHAGEISNYGHKEAKILNGNIGYLKITHFTKWKFFEEAKTTVSNSMNFLQNTDALIVDVRDNPGGFEDIVAYLTSYFFDADSINLQEYYCRYQNSRRKIRTTKEVPGKKLSTIAVFILVNRGTGSTTESFAYILKHLNRATINWGDYN